MEENIKEDTEKKKVRLKKEDIDFLYNKFIEITEDCVVKGYNIDNVQHEFGKLFLIKDSDTKLNLKPFDLEAAKTGKPVCTRDGRKTRIICFDRKDIKPIVALVTIVNGTSITEKALYYFEDGHHLSKYDNNINDLMMLPEKKEGWIIVSKNATIYDSLEEAKESFDSDKELCVCKAEWEE